MAYQALYRTYRPTRFQDVVGQKHIITVLKNAISLDRISHAYVFSGLRGIGKTTIARIFAKAVNCLNPIEGEPCDNCANCLSVMNNETTDVVELDAASNNGVEQIRDILEKVNFLPSFLKKKVYIIDEAHMLSTAAFNALLKTLEEPPAHVIFILATTEPYKIPSTILSRCQRLDFKQINTKEIVNLLSQVASKEQINISEDALYGIAEASEGGMRDALSILDQARAYNFNQITLEDVNNITGRVSQEYLIKIIQALNEKNAQSAFENINLLIETGKEVSRVLTCLIQFCRDLLLYKNLKDDSSITYMYKKEEFISLAETTSEKRLFYYVDSLAEIQNKIRYTNSPKVYLEVGIIKIINNASTDININTKLEQLEEKINLLSPSESVDSLNGILNRIDTLENKIKKLTNVVEKNNYQEFKEDILSKINLLEDLTLANKGIPHQIEEKIQDLEEKIVELKVSQNVVTSSNGEATETKEASLSEEELAKIKEIENKLADLEKLVSTLIQEKPQTIDVELINSQIASLKEELFAKISNISSEDKQGDNSEIQTRMDTVEEYLEMVIATVDDLSKTVKQANLSSNTIESSSGEIAQLNENYFVLLNLVKSMQDKINNVTPASVPSYQDDSIEQLKVEINQKIADLVESLETKMKQTQDSISDTNNKVLEVKNECESQFTVYDTRISDIENKKEIEIPDYNGLINENTQAISEVKEYSISLSAKIQEIQNKVLEINTKLDGGMTKRRSPFEFKEETPTQTQEETKPNKPVPTQPSSTDVETKVVEEETRRVISNPNTVVIKTKPNTIEQNQNDPNNVYDIKIVERILYQAHDQKCRQEKAELLAKWSKLEDKVGHLLSPTAKLLSEGILVANGFNELLIVYPHASMCNHLMEPKGHMNALQVIKIALGKDYDFMALPENTWQEKRSEYAGQFHMGITFPKLTPINNPELKVNVVNTTNLFSKKNTTMHQAQSFFGADMVEKEEE